MSAARRFLGSTAIFVFAASLCSAQSVVSARSGTIHYFEGDVKADGVALVSQRARFSELKEQSVLSTGSGRAEILLTPGVLLRVAENSSVKMLDSRLLSTRVELISGTAMMESDDPLASTKDPAVTIVHEGFAIQPVKSSVIEISSNPSQVRVFKGQANVIQNGATKVVKDGNQISLAENMAISKFDVKNVDDLFVWTRDRSAYLAAGNMASAHSLASSFAGASNGWNPTMWSGFSGGWFYNPGMNVYSFLPFSGTVYGPFGYGLYNPATIRYFYAPVYTWNGAGGARNSTFTAVPMANVLTMPNNSTSGQRLSFANGFHPTMASPARGNEPITVIQPPAFNTSRNGGFDTGIINTPMAAPMPVNIPAPQIAIPVGASPAGGSAIGGASGAARAAGAGR